MTDPSKQVMLVAVLFCGFRRVAQPSDGTARRERQFGRTPHPVCPGEQRRRSLNLRSGAGLRLPSATTSSYGFESIISGARVPHFHDRFGRWRLHSNTTDMRTWRRLRSSSRAHGRPSTCLRPDGTRAPLQAVAVVPWWTTAAGPPHVRSALFAAHLMLLAHTVVPHRFRRMLEKARSRQAFLRPSTC